MATRDPGAIPPRAGGMTPRSASGSRGSGSGRRPRPSPPGPTRPSSVEFSGPARSGSPRCRRVAPTGFERGVTDDPAVDLGMGADPRVSGHALNLRPSFGDDQLARVEAGAEPD